MKVTQIVIDKAGKNVSIAITTENNLSLIFMEDSSNVEMNYNPYSKSVTLSISGGESYTTPDITTFTSSLFMEGVPVTNSSIFFNQYALVFPNGGGGPVTTPTLQDVLNAGNTASDLLGNAGFSLSYPNNPTSNNIDPTGIYINDVGNQANIVISSGAISIQDTNNGNVYELNRDEKVIRIKDNDIQRMCEIYGDKISATDLHSGHNLRINFPALVNDYAIDFPAESGTLQVNTFKEFIGNFKFNFTLNNFDFITTFKNQINPISYIQAVQDGLYKISFGVGGLNTYQLGIFYDDISGLIPHDWKFYVTNGQNTESVYIVILNNVGNLDKPPSPVSSISDITIKIITN